MSILDVNLEAVEEIKIHPSDAEVQLRIADVDIVPVKSDPSRNQLSVRFDDATDPLIDDIYEYIGIPTDAIHEADPKRHAKMAARLKAFLGCFDISSGPVDTDEMVGLTGWCTVRIEEGQDGTERNRIRRFLVRR